MSRYIEKKSPHSNGFIRFYNVLTWLILLAAILYRIYKAHNAGIIYDEVWTYEDFCGSIRQALTNYSSTNNHLLNSVLIVITKYFCGNYEQFLRIPSVISSIIFSVMIYKILKLAIKSRLIFISSLVIVLFNWLIFDLSYLARGYSHAMAAVFTGIFFLLRYAMVTDQGKSSWNMIFLLIVVNFLAMGSMLSCVGILFALNLAFIIKLIMNDFMLNKKKVLLQLTTLISGSALLIFVLYSFVLGQVVSGAENFDQTNKIDNSIYEYLLMVLWHPFVYFVSISPVVNELIYKSICVLLVLVALLTMLFKVFSGRKAILGLFNSPGGLLVFIAMATFMQMMVQQLVLHVSLGMPRNGVFLTIAVLLASLVIFDSLSVILKRVRVLCHIYNAIVFGLLITLLTFSMASPYVVEVHPWAWANQSGVGRLVRDLKEMDSDKNWRLRFDQVTIPCSRIAGYYSNFGYKITVVTDNSFDLLITGKADPNIKYAVMYEKYIKHKIVIGVK